MAVGSAGLVALLISQPLAMKRAVGAICAAMALGGVLLLVKAQALREADRDLDPAQQAHLATALSRFPNTSFQVFTADTGNETRSLASKVAEAVKTGTGNPPAVAEVSPVMKKGVFPPVVQPGVIIVLHDRESEFGRAVANTIGRALMAARVACFTVDDREMDGRTVRIVVGAKP